MASQVEIILKSVDQASPALKKVSGEFKDLSTSAQKAGDTVKKQKVSFTELNSAIQIAGQALQVLKKGYDFAREGAQIDFLQSKFGNLSASIGTTSDALMGDLREATRGTLSDMELMASVTDLVGLGLANSHDEAVRLAKVSAGLGMNMNQLVLTLTNMTTMRFDALGVRVDGFKDKVKALEEQGYSTDAAFKEAFLQQAEAQLQTVGNAADSTAGEFMILEASIKNAWDALKLMTSDAVGPGIKEFNDFRETAKLGNEMLLQYGGTLALTRAQWNQHGERVEAAAAEYRRAEEYGAAWARALDDQTESLVENTVSAEDNAEALKAISDENEQFLSTLGDVAGNLHKYNDGLAEADAQLEAGKITTEEHAAKVAELAGEYENASKRIVASLLEMKYTADGIFTDEEVTQYLLGLEKLGLVTEADRKATITLYQEATTLHTELANGAKNTDMYSDKMKNLIGRQEDSIPKFEALNRGIDNTAEAFADAHGPLSAVTQDLGGLPASGTMWSYYVDIKTTGRVPRLPNGGHEQFDAGGGGGGYAEGGQLGRGWAIVGDAPGGRWTPYTEVITPGGYVLPNDVATRMKDAGLLDGAMALAIGGRTPQRSGSGRAGGGTTGGRTPSTSPGTAPRSSGISTISATSAAASEDTAANVADFVAPVIAETMQSAVAELSASAAQQQTATNRNNDLLSQVLDTLQRIYIKTASEQGIAKGVWESASKRS